MRANREQETTNISELVNKGLTSFTRGESNERHAKSRSEGGAEKEK